ncbi:ependymin-related protein 1-like [Haliotis asinina]|uniref:ependymin-related protein 1-like n=1 Tax=Haliotis asinina TaxID=109174 RepID=UPI003531A8F2
MTLLALLLAGLASTALGSICCPPSQWEAYQFVTRVDPDGAYEGLQSVSYDALNGRYAVEGNYTSGNVNTFKVIYDYRKNVGYRINPQKRLCETFAMKEEFQDTCVPDGAYFFGPFSFGFGTKVIDTRGYSYVRTKDGVTSKYTAIVSDDICIPVITHKVTSTIAGS